MRALWTIVMMFYLASPAAAGQNPAVPDGLAQVAATCAGRLSAWREHQWLFDGRGSEQTARQLAAMNAILEAILPPDAGRGAMALRIEAKAAQRALLLQAAFARDQTLAARAARQASQLLSSCEGLLLG